MKTRAGIFMYSNAEFKGNDLTVSLMSISFVAPQTSELYSGRAEITL